MATKCSWAPHEQVLEVAASIACAAGVLAREVMVVRAPFRICPLGAHVDHQGGCISGMALDFGVTLVFAAREDTTVSMTSSNFRGRVAFDLESVPERRRGSPAAEEACWGNFIRGAAFALKRSNHRLQRGMCAHIMAPDSLDSSGISSSAAVGCACLLALEHVNGLRLSVQENVDFDRIIENEYLGLKNGIMDQSIILRAAKGLLTVVNCNTAAATNVSPPWAETGTEPPFRIMLVFSGIRSALAAGLDFNNRVAECHAAAAQLLQHLGRPDASPILGQITEHEYKEHAAVLGDSTAGRRARHFFSETARVREGAVLWEKGDIVAFGRLTNASGISSEHNYEVGSKQLKFLQSVLHGIDGVFGARFSGAGTRGACVALVDAGKSEAIAASVLQAYAVQFPDLAAAAQIIISQSGDGAQLLSAVH